MTTTSYAKIGSISSGTLVASELAWAFACELNALAKRDTVDAERKARTNRSTAAALDIMAAGTRDEAALAEFVNETAPELFNAYCAPFTSFGAHPGDGADFGIWPDIEGVTEAARYKDGVVQVEAGDAWPELGEDIFYVLEVNDHGNVTLFETLERKVLWACV